MAKKQEMIKKQVEENIEKIESKRYNAKDPVVIIEEADSKEEVIIKLLTAERTGAHLKLGKEVLNPAEDLASRNFYRGVKALNAWQFKKSLEYFDQSANLARDPILQQRINLYKQLQVLLKSVLLSSPDTVYTRSKRSYFEEVLACLPKYDKLSNREQNYYRSLIESLREVAFNLQEGDLNARSQQLIARSAISLSNNEYLAAYIWQYKNYLLNKDEFDAIAKKDPILKEVLASLRIYLQAETCLNEQIEEVPTIGSAYDLQTIFIDHLSTIHAAPFFKETKKNFGFPLFKERNN